jgi:hypothetical protein
MRNENNREKLKKIFSDKRILPASVRARMVLPCLKTLSQFSPMETPQTCRAQERENVG